MTPCKPSFFEQLDQLSAIPLVHMPVGVVRFISGWTMTVGSTIAAVGYSVATAGKSDGGFSECARKGFAQSLRGVVEIYPFAGLAPAHMDTIQSVWNGCYSVITGRGNETPAEREARLAEGEQFVRDMLDRLCPTQAVTKSIQPDLFPSVS